jgi:hypothetical protein
VIIKSKVRRSATKNFIFFKPLRVQGSRFRVQGSGFKVQGWGGVEG